jgi:carbonic anhydrase/acetyltransferase-like protein (isoleucine patch superfamily)
VTLRSHLGVAPVFGAGCFVDETALVIGRVCCAEDVSIWPFAVARGDVNRIDIGARTNIQDGCILHGVHDGPFRTGGLATRIGADVTVGHKAVVHAATVGDRCLIGIGALVLDGAVVEDEVIVAAGTVVPPGKRLASRGLYLGNPARRLRELHAGEIEQVLYTARHYLKLKEEHRGV